MKRISKAGLSLAIFFLLSSLFFFFIAKGDGWAIPVILTLPFSILADYLTGTISDFFGLGITAYNNVETTLILLFGVAEYYLIGLFMGRGASSLLKRQ